MKQKQFLLFKRCHLLFAFILIFNKTAGQSFPNLIPNPSFEMLNKANYNDWFYKGSDFNKMMKFWFSPTGASPDVYTPKTKVPYNWADKGFGKQNAHTGKNYVGITVFGCTDGKPHCREFISIQLIEPLVIGQEYELSFWVNNLLYGIRTNNIGASFTTEQLSEISDAPISLEPYMLVYSPLVTTNLNWANIKGKFKATEESEYLVIGNFYDDANTLTQKAWKNPLPFGYYYIDDVDLHKVPPVLIPTLKNDDLSKISLEIGATITLKEINFDNDKSELHPRSFVELEKLLKILQDHPNMHIEINGHTDNNGEKKYNKKLSIERADAVSKYLVDKKISKKRLTIQGFGDTQPIVTNDTPSGKKKNRRVTFKILTL